MTTGGGAGKSRHTWRQHRLHDHDVDHHVSSTGQSEYTSDLLHQVWHATAQPQRLDLLIKEDVQDDVCDPVEQQVPRLTGTTGHNLLS